MAKFRKKPVVVEAWPVSEILAAATSNWNAVPRPIRDAYEGSDSCVVFAFNHIYIRTLEGEMCGDPGDYVIRGVKGEFYPIKPDIFADTYEPVDEQG